MSRQAGERTEKATPKRKKDAREKGQIFKSAELITAFSMIVLFGALSIFGGGMLDGGYRKKYLRATSRLLALSNG